jgi:hypothetical protein
MKFFKSNQVKEEVLLLKVRYHAIFNRKSCRDNPAAFDDQV